MIFRQYQEEIYQAIMAEKAPGRNVLAVLPTGAGKTVLFSRILAESVVPSFAIAHRQELVAQMSLTLAKNKVEHDILAPRNVVKWILSEQSRVFGRPYFRSGAKCVVAGVDTLNARMDKIKGILDQTGFWVMDEGHHVQKGNKWGKVIDAFPKTAWGLSVTATPLRADGGGLSRETDGVNDVMIVGPTGRELIGQGHLCDYKIYAPPMTSDLSAVGISKSTGDFSKGQLAAHMHKYPIVGDVVDHYLKYAPGQLGITFAVDVQEATNMAAEFNKRGVPAEVIHAKTKPEVRQSVVARFIRGDVKQLVNVDIFGEGFDLPAIEVLSMARPTASFSLYCQQFGRVLRILEGKTQGTIIDHVGNVVRHSKVGLPDSRINWTMDRRDRRASAKDDGTIPVKSCVKCTQIYEAFHKCCPWCGFISIPEKRSTVEYVEGDLTELDLDMINAMRKAVEIVDSDPAALRHKVTMAAGAFAGAGAANRHIERQKVQEWLRHEISMWAGWQKQGGLSDPDINRKFWYLFGIDILSAQALGVKDATKLKERVELCQG